MRTAITAGLIAICTFGFVLSAGPAVAEPTAVETPDQEGPKRLLFLTHAGLYKHTSLGPAERAVASWAQGAGFELTALQGYLQDQESLDLSMITA